MSLIERRIIEVSARSAGAAKRFAYPWIADQGDGTYCNPLLYTDCPDPDVIRDGDDYFMVSSSFANTPGLPIHHCRDLVNWTLINHAIENLPHPRFEQVRAGCGIWAPAIRRHAGRYWIFFAMPDEGIYWTAADHPRGKWSLPHLIQAGKGLIDPCPFWDDDGNAYLVHAYAGSRAGVKHLLRVRPMDPGGQRLLGEGHIVFHDPLHHPTLEGPKLLKRDGFYYILAPAGGVETGWQLALRSRDIFGPYQEKIVLEQGSTAINGPHQGALLDTPTGQWWFIHFQDSKPYGRIPHLQPARWKDGWPLIGVDHDGNGVGEPVSHYRKPAIRANGDPTEAAGDSTDAASEPWQCSDEFDSPALGLRWHWNANHHPHWYSLGERPGWMRLLVQPPQQPADGSAGGIDLRTTPSVLLQKFPARAFSVETRIDFHPSSPRQFAGVGILGQRWVALALHAGGEGGELELACIIDGAVVAAAPVGQSPMILRLHVADGGLCTFDYQTDRGTTHRLPARFQAVAGIWVGAKVGLFAVAAAQPVEAAAAKPHADFDYVRFHPPRSE